MLSAALPLTIRPGGLDAPGVGQLVVDHLSDMNGASPPESVHALGVAALREPALTFWSAWIGDEAVGCVALRELSADHGELKSMRTAAWARRRGVGAALLDTVLREAGRRRYTRLSLETGTDDFFAPARTLYRSRGFVDCGPFPPYVEDPFSTFLTLRLAG